MILQPRPTRDEAAAMGAQALQIRQEHGLPVAKGERCRAHPVTDRRAQRLGNWLSVTGQWALVEYSQRPSRLIRAGASGRWACGEGRCPPYCLLGHWRAGTAQIFRRECNPCTMGRRRPAMWRRGLVSAPSGADQPIGAVGTIVRIRKVAAPDVSATLGMGFAREEAAFVSLTGTSPLGVAFSPIPSRKLPWSVAPAKDELSRTKAACGQTRQGGFPPWHDTGGAG